LDEFEMEESKKLRKPRKSMLLTNFCDENHEDKIESDKNLKKEEKETPSEENQIKVVDEETLEKESIEVKNTKRYIKK
jgi:hypothetical protein